MRLGVAGIKVAVKLTITTHAVRAKVKQRNVLELSGGRVWRLALNEMDATRPLSIALMTRS